MSHAEKLTQLEEARATGAEAHAARHAQLREVNEKIGHLDTQRHALLKQAAGGDAQAHRELDKLAKQLEVLNRSREATEDAVNTLDAELSDLAARIEVARQQAAAEEQAKKREELRTKRQIAAKAWEDAQAAEHTAAQVFERALLEEQIYEETHRVAAVR